MEEQIYATENNEELKITPQAKAYLMETAKWAKFLAIVGFVMIGLMTVVCIAMAIAGAVSPLSLGMMEMGTFGGAIYFGVMSILMLVYIVPTYFLYKFGVSARRSLLGNSSHDVTEAMGYQKSLYKFIGVFTVIFMGLYALIIVGVIIVALIAS